MKNCNNKIAEAAYYIWQSQGCPNGMEETHWAMACEQLSKGCKKTSCSVKKTTVKKATKKAPVKKAVAKKATTSKPAIVAKTVVKPVVKK